MKILEPFRGTMNTPLGRELLMEMQSAPWNNSHSKYIEELSVAFGTSTGTKRSQNEDRLVVANITSQGGEVFKVAMICDGVGGSELGEVAATLAITVFCEELYRVKVRTSITSLLIELVRKTDDAVRRALFGKGTTTASIVLTSGPDQIVATNIGDSRIYSWDPKSSKLEQLSVDDTLENEFERLPNRDPTFLHARGLHGSLSQAIGEVGRTSADLRILPIVKNSFQGAGVILATDGAWKSDERGFISLLQNASSSIEATRRTLAFSSWTGGIDNVSIIAIENLRQFATERRLDSYVNIGLGRLAAWICDQKFVALGLESVTPEVKNPLLHNQARDKTRVRKKAKTPRKAGPQTDNSLPLDLDSSDIEHGEPKKIRPKVEVSTDEEPPKTDS